MIFLFSSIFKRIFLIAFLSLWLCITNVHNLLAENKNVKAVKIITTPVKKKQSNGNATTIKKKTGRVADGKMKSKNKQDLKKNKKVSTNNNKNKQVKKTNNNAKQVSSVQSASVNTIAIKEQQPVSVKKDKISELIDDIESGKIKIAYHAENLLSNSNDDGEDKCVIEHYAGMVGDKSKSTGMNLDLFLEAKNKSDFILIISGKNVNDEKQVKTALSIDSRRFAMDILFDKNSNKTEDIFSLKDNIVNFTYQIPKNVRLKYGHQKYGYTIALYFDKDVKITYQKRSTDEIAIKFSIKNIKENKKDTNITSNKNINDDNLKYVINDYALNSSANDKIFINHKKPIIVAIDPGHGGVDSGAIGANNVFEKNIALKYAQKLKDVLKKHGFKVVMIRDADKTIPLGRRVKIAKDANADVYISLHTDANENKKAHGTTIYSLSKLDTGHPHWKKFHSRTYLPRSYVDYMGNFNVLDILIDMSHKYLLEQSRVLTDNILSRFKAKNICKRCRHGQRSFAVLRGLDMVSILVEIGYITNDEELARMQNEEYMNTFIDNLGSVIKDTFVNKM